MQNCKNCKRIGKMRTSEHIKQKYNIYSEGIAWYKCSSCHTEYGRQYENKIQVVESCPHCGQIAFMENHT